MTRMKRIPTVMEAIDGIAVTSKMGCIKKNVLPYYVLVIDFTELYFPPNQKSKREVGKCQVTCPNQKPGCNLQVQ